MTVKERFIEEIENLLEETNTMLSEESMNYLESLKVSKGGSKVITENGLKILQFMQENWERHNNIFKASEIGEGLFISGSMRKLVSDGYAKKEGKDPVVYSITDKGKTFELTE